MLMMIVAVVIGVLIALVIYNNPEIFIDLIKLAFYGAIGIGALFLVVMIYLSVTNSGSQGTKKMALLNIKVGINDSDELINRALSLYESINTQCPQKVFNKNLGVSFEFNFKKYLLIESSCTPQDGNQNFDYLNLIEVDSIGNHTEVQAVNFYGRLDSINFQDGLININYAGYGVNDSKCCPSLSTNDRYEILDGRLVKK